MWKTQIIKAFNSDALADKVSAALNKLQGSPEVKGAISVQYTAVATIRREEIAAYGNVKFIELPATEYSCMLVYDKVRSFDSLATPEAE